MKHRRRFHRLRLPRRTRTRRYPLGRYEAHTHEYPDRYDFSDPDPANWWWPSAFAPTLCELCGYELPIKIALVDHGFETSTSVPWSRMTTLKDLFEDSSTSGPVPSDGPSDL